MNNPFLHDFPIEINTLPSRQTILRPIWSRINTGQSVLIVSEPWMKKGKLLSYIASVKDNFQSEWDLLFSFIDISTLGDDITVADFWKIVKESLVQPTNSPNIKETILEKISLSNDEFDTIQIERLFEQFSKNHIRLVLLIDEFNLLTQHHSLRTAKMFGTLRYFATDKYDCFVIVGASRNGALELFNATKDINGNGSPFYNYFSEIRLSVLSQRDMSILLGDYLSKQDKLFAMSVSGGHPYILQIVSSLLWELKPDRYKNPLERYKEIGNILSEKTRAFYESSWSYWSNDIQKTLISIAIFQIPDFVENYRFRNNDIFQKLPEIRYLLSIGIIEKSSEKEKSYKVSQGAFLWWITEKIEQLARPETELKEWLQEKQKVGILFTNQDIEFAGKAATYIGKVLDKGVLTLIESYAKASLIK